MSEIVYADYPAVISGRAKSWKAYSTVAGGALYNMFMGSVYITGNLQPYVISYFQVNENKASILLPTVYFLNSVFVWMFGRFTQMNVQPKLLIAIGAGFALTFFLIATNATSFWMFWFFYCCGFGLLTGFTYMISFHHTWLWFP